MTDKTTDVSVKDMVEQLDLVIRKYRDNYTLALEYKEDKEYIQHCKKQLAILNAIKQRIEEHDVLNHSILKGFTMLGNKPKSPSEEQLNKLIDKWATRIVQTFRFNSKMQAIYFIRKFIQAYELLIRGEINDK